MSEQIFSYSAYDIGRILTTKSCEQDRRTPEGEQMAYLLNTASLFLGIQEGMNARLRKMLGLKPEPSMEFKCPIDLDAIPGKKETVRSSQIQTVSKKENCKQILRGLISYHKRMTMEHYPERDFYVDALEYALECVEEKNKM